MKYQLKIIEMVDGFHRIRNYGPCILPVLKSEFVNWDDDKNFYENNVITEINHNNFGITQRKFLQQVS